MPQDPAVHMHVAMPPTLFSQQLSQQLDPASSVMDMHMSMSAYPPPADSMSSMDVLAPPPPQSASPDSLLDLQTQAAMYTMDPRFASLDTVDPSHPSLSSPSATSASTGASHASSPGVTPSYTTGPSSLASALDNNDTTRSRSGSAPSPANLTASSELGYSSCGSGPSTTGHESGFHFPPPEYETPVQSDSETMQDVPGGAHLMAIGDMLKKCVSAHSSL